MDAAGWVQCDENTHSSGCASEAHGAVGAEEKSETEKLWVQKMETTMRRVQKCKEKEGWPRWSFDGQSQEGADRGGRRWKSSLGSVMWRDKPFAPQQRLGGVLSTSVCVCETQVGVETGFTSRIGHSVKLRFNCRFLFYFSSALLNVTHFKTSGLGRSPWHWCVCFTHTGTFLFVISSNISCSLDTFVDITQPLNSKCDMITQSGETLNIEISP